MTTLQELIARRSQLQAELARVEAAIAAFSDATPVEIRTHRNLRNTGNITVDPAYAGEMMVVFADETLTTPAESSWHEGFVVRAAWEAFKLAHPRDVGDYIWEV